MHVEAAIRAIFGRMTTRRGRPTHAEAKELDRQLREAAVATFLEHGYDGTTMEAVARAAGITKRTLYARYTDKHELFITVIPWALSRLDEQDVVHEPEGDDVAASLIAIGRAAIARAVDPKTTQLMRLAMYETSRFPEFDVKPESMAWSAQHRAVADALRRHQGRQSLVIADVELAAEQFLAIVVVLPGRLADFGVFRSPEEEELRLQHAVTLFLNGMLPR